MAALLNFWNSPNKHSNAPTNGTMSNQRGTKRKAKPDPYEDVDEEDDDMIPARKTPTSQRTVRSRLPSATPSSATRSRISLTHTRHPGRPSINAPPGPAQDTAITSQPTADLNLPRAIGSDNTIKQSDSRAPEAPMGDSELLDNGATDALAPSNANPFSVTGDASSSLGKRRVRSSDAPSNQRPREEKRGEEGVDNREIREIARIIRHRMASDDSGSVELLVQWVGEDEEDATWEIEMEIQQGAEDVLYDYWRAHGGRINALFHKPRNPPPEVYHVFKVLRHEKKNRGGYQFEVQWVGHPATRGETSMETEKKLGNVAPQLLHEYWESIGGRASHVPPRGGHRSKKMRAE